MTAAPGAAHGPGTLGPVVVAVPVKDEQDHLAACLEALDHQTAGRADHILLLLNNCSDATPSIANRMRARLTATLHVVEIALPPALATAGHARRLAMDAACRLAGGQGLLLTTDADARVDPDWVGANLAAIRVGADAVAGWVELDAPDWAAIPLRLHEDDARECAYDTVCDEIHALLDPDPADPWPRHTQASGASIAVTAAAYRAAGGMPAPPVGEDRAFIAALRRIDARVRHAPECRVVVSGRIEGRAAGGMADTIRRRMTAPDAFIDDRLEPAIACARRATLRALAGRAYRTGRLAAGLEARFGLSRPVLADCLRRATFGAAWEAIEAQSPQLVRRRVPVRALAAQQAT
ncbi:glycosyltransferase, partial [Acidisphaera rubrifaciens]|uniref:glycosyltransferase n=1 Tax=Acidisphaera rubrifaciens TaxID=50715 RepID=UPI0006628EA8